MLVALELLRDRDEQGVHTTEDFTSLGFTYAALRGLEMRKLAHYCYDACYRITAEGRIFLDEVKKKERRRITTTADLPKHVRDAGVEIDDEGHIIVPMNGPAGDAFFEAMLRKGKTTG